MRKTFFVLMLCALFMLPVFARDLSLEDAVKLGAEQNLNLKNAKLTLDATKNDYKYSYNTFIPDVSVSATFSKANENTAVAVQNRLDGKSVPNTPWAFTVGISGSWTFNPAMITNISIAKEKYVNGEITYEQAEKSLKKDISKAYYGILLQEETLKIQEATLKGQEARYKQAQRDFDNGYIPEIALLQSQVAYQNSIPVYENSLVELKNSKRQFALLLGLDVNEELNLTTPIEVQMITVSAENALKTLNDRFDLRLLASQEKSLKLQKTALIESTFLPSVVIKAGWQPHLYDMNKYGSDYWVDTGSFSGTVAWNLTNILPTSGKFSNLKKLNISMEQLQQGRKLAEDAAKIEVLNLLDTLNQTKTSLESSESTVSLARANYNMREKAYSEGNSDYLDLVDAETSLNQALLQRLLNQYYYISALIDLEYAAMQDFR